MITIRRPRRATVWIVTALLCVLLTHCVFEDLYQGPTGNTFSIVTDGLVEAEFSADRDSLFLKLVNISGDTLRDLTAYVQLFDSSSQRNGTLLLTRVVHTSILPGATSPNLFLRKSYAGFNRHTIHWQLLNVNNDTVPPGLAGVYSGIYQTTDLSTGDSVAYRMQGVVNYKNEFRFEALGPPALFVFAAGILKSNHSYDVHFVNANQTIAESQTGMFNAFGDSLTIRQQPFNTTFTITLLLKKTTP